MKDLVSELEKEIEELKEQGQMMLQRAEALERERNNLLVEFRRLEGKLNEKLEMIDRLKSMEEEKEVKTEVRAAPKPKEPEPKTPE